jgi:RHS repeat-associated protein
MGMASRKYQLSAQYKYGFNGKENDKETVGTGEGTQDYGMRIYNPALGRFLSVDPLTKKYAYYSPYQFAGNMPIRYVDLDGLEPAAKGSEEGEMKEAEVNNGPHKGEVINWVWLKGTWNASLNPVTVSPVKTSPGAVLMGGADFLNDGTMGINKDIANTVANAAIQQGIPMQENSIVIINSPLSAKADYKTEVLDPVVEHIKKVSANGGAVVLYGYSYGGHILMQVLNDLKALNIKVDLLITVDAASGPNSYFRSNQIPDNVKLNLNFYQTAASPILSHGQANQGANVINVDLSGEANSKGNKIYHANIDEYTKLFSEYWIIQAFKGQGALLKNFTPSQIKEKLIQYDKLQTNQTQGTGVSH